jgi:hypothetical protein
MSTDPESLDRKLKRAELAIALAINVYIVWIVLPAAWKDPLIGAVRQRRELWRRQAAWESDQAHMRWESWLLTKALEEYNNDHGNLNRAVGVSEE